MLKDLTFSPGNILTFIFHVVVKIKFVEHDKIAEFRGQQILCINALVELIEC